MSNPVKQNQIKHVMFVFGKPSEMGVMSRGWVSGCLWKAWPFPNHGNIDRPHLNDAMGSLPTMLSVCVCVPQSLTLAHKAVTVQINM